MPLESEGEQDAKLWYYICLLVAVCASMHHRHGSRDQARQASVSTHQAIWIGPRGVTFNTAGNLQNG